MRRRDFLAAGAIAATGTRLSAMPRAEPTQRARPAAATGRSEPFKLKYAPPLGMFRDHAADPVDQIKFAADHGFRAIEDNGMRRRPVEEQERIRVELERQGMAMGVFVVTLKFNELELAAGQPDHQEALLADVRASVEVAKRVGARWCTVVPGRAAPGLEPGFQTANVIESLKRAAEVCEPSGLCMVLEPLNPWRDHPGLFLQKIPDAFLICRAVASPSCKILFDIYHQQITEGNLIPNIDKAWSEIGYLQIGDNPGRKEPTTGEINYKNVFKHLHQKGYEGILGMEHGRSRPGLAGELRVIEAYRECDDFE